MIEICRVLKNMLPQSYRLKLTSHAGEQYHIATTFRRRNSTSSCRNADQQGKWDPRRIALIVDKYKCTDEEKVLHI
jgi:hypothetical protein